MTDAERLTLATELVERVYGPSDRNALRRDQIVNHCPELLAIAATDMDTAVSQVVEQHREHLRAYVAVAAETLAERRAA